MIYILHNALRKLASLALVSFYSELRVVGEENVPKDGPLIVVATHHNMMVDPAVLSSLFPHKRPLHYWAKSTLFANPIAGFILKSAGNIPVDRTTKDNSILFKGTFETLAMGEAVAVFPEGTSYTECRIMQVKEGAAWVALEFLKWSHKNKFPKATAPQIVVAGITYTQKAKYRSKVIMEFSKPLNTADIEKQFLCEEEGARRIAAKRLTKMLEQKMVELTINAPDWETLFAARTARDLLWPDERKLNPDYFVVITQTLIDLFLTPDFGPNFTELKRALLVYDSLLQSSRFTNSALSSLPLPPSLNPNRAISVFTRLLTLLFLVRDTFMTIIRLPFFIIPLIIHAPIYFIARYGGKLVEDEEETQAQNKLIFGLLLTLIAYGSCFAIVWTVMSKTVFGALIAAMSVYAVSIYHQNMIDDNYAHLKKLTATWRILVGIWIPKRFDITSTSLTPYTTPFIPPMSPYIGKKIPSSTTAKSVSSQRIRPRGPPSRRLVKHVLRARIEAARALAEFLREIERSGVKVRAATHLARMFGGTIDPDAKESKGVGLGLGANVPPSASDPAVISVDPSASTDARTFTTPTEPEGVLPFLYPQGWRSGKEVVRLLRNQGANMVLLQDISKVEEEEWALVSSDGEVEPEEELENVSEPLSFVPSSY